MLVAIDTSSDESGVALYDASGVVAECAWRSGRRHAEQVLPTVELLMRHLESAPGDIQAVAVATGPGSWSGLRVGMSLAKAIAVANEVPLLGVPTLDMLAYAQRYAERTILALVRLGRDRYGAAEYEPLSDVPRRRGPFRNLGPGEWQGFSDRLLVCGELDAAARAYWAERGPGVIVIDGMQNVRRPAALAELAWRRFRAGEADDVVSLEPIYLASPVRG